MIAMERSEPKQIEGLGLGLRAPHYQAILESDDSSIWYEALIDNYMGDGGLPLHYLERIASQHPLSFHGVGLSLGSTDPLNERYLARLKSLVSRFQPAHISDHLCWNSVAGVHGHDLFPLPYTEEAINHVAERIARVQDYLGRQILIENVSSYIQFQDSYMTEVEFLCAVIEKADCLLLCDINNIFVSACNHDFDPLDYMARLPGDRIREFHLAGYEDQGTHLLDTHGAPVHDAVWDLYRAALKQFGPVPTLIEWDTNIPEYAVLLAELDKAKAHWSEVLHAA